MAYMKNGDIKISQTYSYGIAESIGDGQSEQTGDKGETGESDTTPIVDSTLNLTTDKYQTTTMENNTTIVLPTVDTFTEINLFFDTTEALTLIFPSIKWQTTPNIEADSSYEFIFTYVNGTWLGGYIVRK